MIKQFITLVFLILLVSCNVPIIDKGMSAVEGQDSTAPIKGCGNQPISGYTYCRKKEGDATNDKLWFYGPKTNCDREACVYFKVYFPDGSPSYEGSIPKDKNSAHVLWSDIIKSPRFEVGDRGFWPYIYRVYWKDSEGHERMSASDGEIRLKVYRAEYEPLHNSVDNPNYTWFWEDKGFGFKTTTGMRVYIGKK